MPQPLRVDSAQLRLRAGQLDTVTNEASTQLTAIAGAMAGCQSGWVGSTHTAFEQLRESWDTADAARARSLDVIETNVLQSAALYDHTDQGSRDDINRTL